MKVIKVIYNNECEFIMKIVDEVTEPHILEEYNISYRQDRKKAREIMERHGTKKLPLIILEDENLEEYAAIWSEQNPDWKVELIKKMSDE